MAYWIIHLIVYVLCFLFGYGVRFILEAGKCYDCETERNRKFKEMLTLRQFRPAERQNG